MNKELLKKVADHILEEPRRLEMETWYMELDGWQMEESDAPPCGTTACIAGWAVLLSGVEIFKEDSDFYFEEEAIKVLEISRLLAGKLFFTHSWPEEFFRVFHRLGRTTPKQRAQAAADRINHFMEIGE